MSFITNIFKEVSYLETAMVVSTTLAIAALVGVTSPIVFLAAALMAAGLVNLEAVSEKLLAPIVP